MYEQRVGERPATGYDQPQTERVLEPVDIRGLREALREEAPIQEPSVKERTAQQVLQEYEIRIEFLDKGCIVRVGCKSIAFTTVQEAMDSINYYVADPKTVGEYWRGQFNM